MHLVQFVPFEDDRTLNHHASGRHKGINREKLLGLESSIEKAVEAEPYQAVADPSDLMDVLFKSDKPSEDVTVYALFVNGQARKLSPPRIHSSRGPEARAGLPRHSETSCEEVWIESLWIRPK
ncbi:hypothetical protein ACFQX6_18075 [Streptosporangium lutulentum]